MKDYQKAITAISIFLMLFGKFLPPIMGLTSTGMAVLCIFAGVILLWLTVSVSWPCVLCIVALIMTDVYGYSDGMKASFGSWVVAFVMFSSMVTYTLRQTGFLKRVAAWFITRPIAKKNPWMFLTVLFLAVIFIGSFMSPVPDFVVFLPIIEEIFNDLGYQKGDRFPAYVTLSVLFFASLSTMTTPIAHTVPILAFSLYEETAGAPIDLLKFTVFGVVTTLAVLLVVMLYLRFVVKLDVSRLQKVDEDKFATQGKMSIQEKITMWVFICVIIMWFLPGLIKNSMPGLYAFLSDLGTPGPALIGTVVLCLIHIDGKPLMNISDTMKNGVSWVAILMVAATGILGSAMTNKDVGITAAFTSALAPAFGNMNPWLFVIIVSVLTVLITNFASNTATVTILCSIVLPLVFAGGAISNVNAAAVTCVIGAGASVACATPASTAHAAIAGGSGWVDTRTMLKAGLAESMIAALLIALVGYPILAALM